MSASNGSDGSDGRVGTTGGTTHFVCLRCGAVDAGDHGCGGIADVEVETRLNPRLISESETEREQLETEQALKTLAALVEAFELVLVAQTREDAVRGQCVEIARRAARATTGYTKTTALFIAQRIEEARVSGRDERRELPMPKLRRRPQGAAKARGDLRRGRRREAMSNPVDSAKNHYRFHVDAAPREVRCVASQAFSDAIDVCGCGERDCCDCRAVRRALRRLHALRVWPPMRIL